LGPTDGTPPISILLSGESYFEAAERLAAAIGECHLKPGFEIQPVYYLYRHALELAMKAFLRSGGVTVRELAGHRLGHNLGRLYNEALAYQLPLDEEFRKLTRRVIRLLDRADREQQSRYVILGVQQMPDLAAVRHVGRGLFAAIRPYCSGSDQPSQIQQDELH
jgi:hypothetical protein